MKLRTVRPKEIFARWKAPSNDREIRLKMPEAKDLAMLETGLLIAAMKSVNATRVFEFGTYLGATTLNLALNLPENGMVYTLDLPQGAKIEQNAADALLTQEYFASVPAFDESWVSKKILRLFGDSRCMISLNLTLFEFIFIDGGHDRATVMADTKNAFRMLMPGGCIAWHDYGHPTYPEVTEYLESLPEKPLAVGDTMLAFHFSERK